MRRALVSREADPRQCQCQACVPGSATWQRSSREALPIKRQPDGVGAAAHHRIRETRIVGDTWIVGE